MSEPNPTDPQGPNEVGVGESVRAAVERTMRATAGSAATTRDRAGELVDEVVRRGRDAGAGLARRGQEATGEVGRRLELLEQRLAELEARLGAENGVDAPQSNPEVEG